MTIQWTEEQKAILGHNSGTNARILAGPGTGKSATTVELIGRLLSENPAPTVRMLTFTRAATFELTKKVTEHEATATLQPSTVHSFAISVLMQNPGTGQFPEPLRIADDWEQKEIIFPTLANRINVQPRRVSKLFTELASNWEALDNIKDELVDPDERARFLAAWQEHRNIFGYTLLSELPWALRRALVHHPDLDGIGYGLLVVDEYQDLNACDLDLLKKLSERGSAIVAIGDDDQSIYSFRRAAPEGIRRFHDDYENAVDYPLSITHRCGSNILDWAANVIARDTGRDHQKAMPTPATGSPNGEAALLAFAGQQAEPEGIADLTEHLINNEGVSASEILILLRSDHNGTFSKPIKDALTRRGINYADPDEVKSQLALPENRKLLACARLLANRSDSLAWATMLELTSGIGNRFIDWIYEQARDKNQQFGVTVLEAFENEFDGGPRSSAYALDLVSSILSWLDDQTVPEIAPDDGWGRWIIELADEELLTSPTEVFAEILRGVDEYIDSEADFSRYLSQISPIARDRSQAVGDRVRIMTMAASKGLTVEATIVAAAEEGITPSRKRGSNTNEECRLLYVAMTRSKRFLFCTWARLRRGPTARAGLGRTSIRRNPSSFFANGPVNSQDGHKFILNRWPNN